MEGWKRVKKKGGRKKWKRGRGLGRKGWRRGREGKRKQVVGSEGKEGRRKMEGRTGGRHVGR